MSCFLIMEISVMKMKDRFPLAYDSIKKPVAYDDHGQFITNRDGERVLDIRGWG